MYIKNWKKEIFTIPNLLSLFRLLLIPVYVTIYLHANTMRDYFLAAAILAVSCLTDLVDGKIARQYNQVSTLGKILDPFADKTTQFTLILFLAVKYPVIWLMATLFVIKESFQLIAALVNLKRGRMLSGALLSGKLCTAILFISLIVIIVNPLLPEDIINTITSIDLIFMAIALGNYIFTYCKCESKFQTVDHPGSFD